MDGAGALVLLQVPPLPGTVVSFNSFSGFSLTKQGDWATYEGRLSPRLSQFTDLIPRAPGVSLGQGLTLMSPGPRGSINCFSRTGKASAARRTSCCRIWRYTDIRQVRSDYMSSPRPGLLFS